MLTALRDHLKAVHALSQETCDLQLNFKETSFKKLGTIDLKWKRVFHILFPEVPTDNIPSPCKSPIA